MKDNGLVIFNGNGDNSKVTTNKSGATLVKYYNKKEYGQLHNLKGGNLTRAHIQYRFERAVKGGNTNVAALIARGEILIESMRMAKSGDSGSFGFTMAHKLGVIKADPTVEAGKLTDDQLLAIIAARKAAPATQQPTA